MPIIVGMLRQRPPGNKGRAADYRLAMNWPEAIGGTLVIIPLGTLRSDEPMAVKTLLKK